MTKDSDPFYIGYAAAPGKHKFFAWLVTPVLIALGALAAHAFSVAQSDTGPGVWRLSETSTIEGVFVRAPYPMMRVMSEDGRLETWILTTTGKMVPDDRLMGLTDGYGEAVGNIVERDGRRSLAVADGADALRAKAGPDGWQATYAAPKAEPIGAYTLAGEIIDPKCWFGVMKPADGMTHKACAALCLLGGIAPMFRTLDAEGVERVYLLTDAEGGAIKEEVIEFVAENVSISGFVERRGDMDVFKIDPSTVQRISS